jgi:hypothetical protein
MEPTRETVKEAIERLLAIPELYKLVDLYLAGPPSTPFAGRLFDTLGEDEVGAGLHNNFAFEITSNDLVAVSLLDVRFGAKAVNELLVLKSRNAALRQLPVGVDLWTVDDRTVDDLVKCFELLRALPGVGRTKASKLLARKRPQLAPIVDSLVETFYGSTGWGHLRLLRAVLADSPGLIRGIDNLARCEDASRPSTLRTLDIAIWMTRSSARSAKDARRIVYGAEEPLLLKR